MAEVGKLEEAADEVLSSLLDEESLKWVRESALTERAFLIGANRFAEAAFPDQESKRLGAAIMRTLWHRRDGDPFLGSEAGKLYSDFRQQLDAYFSASMGGDKADFPEGLLHKLSDTVERVSDENAAALDACRDCFEQIWHGLAVVKDTPEPDQAGFASIHRIATALEDPLRFLSGGKAP